MNQIFAALGQLSIFERFLSILSGLGEPKNEYDEQLLQKYAEETEEYIEEFLPLISEVQASLQLEYSQHRETESIRELLDFFNSLFDMFNESNFEDVFELINDKAESITLAAQTLISFE